MPTHADRRRTLSDACITVLARDGVHGLTHRRIDGAAGVPLGTTSRYFRTRAALLLGAAAAVLESHEKYVQQLAETLPRNRVGLVDALERIINDADGSNRELYVARFELGLEAVRDQRIRVIMNNVRSASLELTRDHLASAGVGSSDHELDAMASFLTGVLFDRITVDRPQVESRTLAKMLIQGLVTRTVND